MLTAPEGMFRIFHRHLPTMEILVAGKTGDRQRFYITVANMETIIQFEKEVTPTETLQESMQEILIAAHQLLYQSVQIEKGLTLEAGGHVH